MLITDSLLNFKFFLSREVQENLSLFASLKRQHISQRDLQPPHQTRSIRSSGVPRVLFAELNFANRRRRQHKQAEENKNETGLPLLRPQAPLLDSYRADRSTEDAGSITTRYMSESIGIELYGLLTLIASRNL